MRWTEEEKAAFVARFPRLHHWPDGRPRTYSWACGRGWIPLLERVFAFAEADPRATIRDVYQKYGGLRIDLRSYDVDPELVRTIDEVEGESDSICEACGERFCKAHLVDIATVGNIGTAHVKEV